MLAELRALAGRNRPLVSMIGLGYYGTHTPAVIRRNVLENPAWYTAYTPYQPEISQGRLEALLNFQTMVADLTGLPTANASLLDEATAAAEAMTLARRVVARPRATCTSSTPTPCRRRSRSSGPGPSRSASTVHVLDLDADELPEEFFGVHLQYPGASGAVRDHARAGRAGPRRRARWSPSPPTCWRCACCARRARSAPTSRSAAPSASACRWASAARTPATWRSAPAWSARCPAGWSGCPATPTAAPAYRLALQTREQHIRREKATSNICTAQVLLAVMASMYAVYHGPDGLRAIAGRHPPARRPARRRPARGRRRTGARRRSSTRVTAIVPGRAADVVGRRRRARGQPAPGRRRHGRRRLRRDDDAGAPVAVLGGVRRARGAGGRPTRCRRRCAAPATT